MFVGRTTEVKRALYRARVESLEPFGLPEGGVKIILIEVDPSNVGMRGGRAACDAKLGYEIVI